LWVAADVLPHVGSIQFRPSTVRAVLDDLGRTLARQGFKRIWISNFHGGPRHFGTLEAAADRVSRRYGIEMVSIFSLLLARLTRDGGHELDHVLGDVEGIDVEDLRGDVHGGLIETSLMMSLIGEHVGDPTGLSPQTLDGWRAARGKPPGRRKNPVAEFSDSYLFFFENSYAGAPARASAEIGARILDRLAGRTADALEELWDGRVRPEQGRSPLWRWRHLILNPWVGWAFERWNGAKSPVW
jgi:creatinine amidohydrolase/Fe(II)-dependent formamide hydrolase-like protein